MTRGLVGLVAAMMLSSAVWSQDTPAAAPDPAAADQTQAAAADLAVGDNAADADISTADAGATPDPAAADALEAADVEPLSPLAAVRERVDFFIDAGGPVIVVLLYVSVLALAVILVKVAQFLLVGAGGRGFVAKVADRLRANDREGALALLAKRRSPIARVMEAAIRGRMAPGASIDLVKDEVTRIAQNRLDGLERGLPLLGLIATVAPLLGLLGTVTGMIEAFQQLQLAGDQVDPGILAGGIWEALLTTAAGLSIAIPAAAIYTWLQRTVDVTAQRMEDAATQVFTVDLYGAGAGA